MVFASSWNWSAAAGRSRAPWSISGPAGVVAGRVRVSWVQATVNGDGANHRPDRRAPILAKRPLLVASKVHLIRIDNGVLRKVANTLASGRKRAHQTGNSENNRCRTGSRS